MGLVSADDGVWAAVLAAKAMCTYADCFALTAEFPPIMDNGTGGPFALGEGAEKWGSAASKLDEAQQKLSELTEALPRDYWNGDDREKFDTEIKNLLAEIGDAHNYAMAVSITLGVITAPMAAWPIMCDTIGVIEAAEATAFYIAVASVIGNLGASEAIFAEGEAVTATCMTVLNVSMGIVIAIMAAATAAIAIGDVADIAAQEGHGDTGILGEFGKAAVDSSGEVATSVALDYLSHHGKGEGEGEGEGEGAGHGEGEGEGASGSHGEGEGDGAGGSHGEGEGTGEGEGDGANGSHGEGEGEGEGSGDGEGEGEGEGNDEEEENPFVEHYTDKLKEQAGSQLSTALINGTASTIDPSWNKPDAPKADDEQWGAGE